MSPDGVVDSHSYWLFPRAIQNGLMSFLKHVLISSSFRQISIVFSSTRSISSLGWSRYLTPFFHDQRPTLNLRKHICLTAMASNNSDNILIQEENNSGNVDSTQPEDNALPPVKGGSPLEGHQDDQVGFEQIVSQAL